MKVPVPLMSFVNHKRAIFTLECTKNNHIWTIIYNTIVNTKSVMLALGCFSRKIPILKIQLSLNDGEGVLWHFDETDSQEELVYSEQP